MLWVGEWTALPALVADEGDDHGVEVEEEHEQVEAELDEGFLLVHVQLAEDLGRVEEVLVFEDSVRTYHISIVFVFQSRLSPRHVS